MYEPSVQLRCYKGSYRQVKCHEMKYNCVHLGEAAKRGTESPTFSVLQKCSV